MAGLGKWVKIMLEQKTFACIHRWQKYRSLLR